MVHDHHILLVAEHRLARPVERPIDHKALINHCKPEGVSRMVLLVLVSWARHDG